MEGIGGELAGHRHAVVEQAGWDAKAGNGLAEEPPGRGGARGIDRQWPYEAPAAADTSICEAANMVGSDGQGLGDRGR